MDWWHQLLGTLSEMQTIGPTQDLLNQRLTRSSHDLLAGLFKFEKHLLGTVVLKSDCSLESPGELRRERLELVGVWESAWTENC